VKQQAQAPDVVHEMRAQIDTARASGVSITHLDTHMWAVARATPAEYLKLGRSYGVPVLMDHHALPIEIEPNAVLIDQILGLQAAVPVDQWLKAYEDILKPLPAGTYELIVHLAYADNEMQASTYDRPNWGAQWRENELNMVKSQDFQRFLKDQGFVLVSWRELAKALPATWKSGAN